MYEWLARTTRESGSRVCPASLLRVPVAHLTRLSDPLADRAPFLTLSTCPKKRPEPDRLNQTDLPDGLFASVSYGQPEPFNEAFNEASRRFVQRVMRRITRAIRGNRNQLRPFARYIRRHSAIERRMLVGMAHADGMPPVPGSTAMETNKASEVP